MYIRNYLEIPLNGFATSEEGSAWHNQQAIRSDEIMDSSEFRKKEAAVTILLKKNKITRQEANKRLKEIYAVLPFNFLTRSVKELVEEFNLPESYQEALRYYIYRNEFFFVPAASYTVGSWDTGDSIAEARYVPLRVYAKLTDKDLKGIKEEVNKFFGEKLPFIQNIKAVEERLEAERLKKEGWEYDEISGKSYKLSDEEIAERVLGNRKKKSKVYESVRGLKTLRKRRFGKAGKL